MANDGFKTVKFGGFDKQEVLVYIEQQKKHEAEALDVAQKKYDKLDALVKGLQSDNASLYAALSAKSEKPDTSEENEKLKAELSNAKEEMTTLREDITSKQNTIDAYLEEMKLLGIRNKEMEAKLAQIDAQEQAKVNSEIEILKTENLQLRSKLAQLSEIESENQSLKDQIAELESQNAENSDYAAVGDLSKSLGSTLVKAQLFADSLIENAKQDAMNIKKDTASELTEINSKIADIDKLIKDFGEGLNSDFEQLNGKLGSISDKLTKTIAEV